MKKIILKNEDMVLFGWHSTFVGLFSKDIKKKYAILKDQNSGQAICVACDGVYLECGLFNDYIKSHIKPNFDCFSFDSSKELFEWYHK